MLVGNDLRARATQLLENWSQEEAEKLIVHVSLSLDRVKGSYGVFRHGGRVGLAKATYDQPWVAELFVRALREKCQEAEFLCGVCLGQHFSRDFMSIATI